MKTIILFCLVVLASSTSAQINQNIRGIVTDKDSKMTLPGANVVVSSTTPIKGCVSDINGHFKLPDVPIGRHNIQISYVGYETKFIQNIELTSGKELILNIELQESIVMEEVIISAKQDKDKAINKMATVSARTFSVEETQRYAGSLNDVARMAQNFAGVQGANDSRNDIVIRGNSPTGVLFRLEGVDVPNPNHFALNGTTGGPVSILNNNVLDNSDFMTGAFPAEYGNALAGVFDLKIRNGNNEKHETLGQIGFNGLEITTEGPISKKNFSSYLISYRYSTLELFQKMGFNFGTGTAVPSYQDATFKLNFPNKKGKTEVWGVGGLSNISFLDSEQKDPNLFSEQGEDLSFYSKIGVVTIANTYRLNEKAFIKTSFSVDATYNKIVNDTLNKALLAYYPYYRNTSIEGKEALSVIYTNKINTRHLLKIGSYNQRRFFNLKDSLHLRLDSIYNPLVGEYSIIEPQWRQLTNYNGATYFIQPFAQWQFRINEKWTLNTGIHSQYFFYNKTYAIEPRLGTKWKINKKNTFSAAFGVHNQLPPTRLFFRQQTDAFGNVLNDANGSAIITNKNLKMIQSNHYVLAYDRLFGLNTRLKIETYYQQLSNVPVDYNLNYYSVLNFGANFDLAFPDTLKNKGTGINYGVELTLERFLHNGFYYLFTGSLYQSKYAGSDGIERNTAFNGNYTCNILLGKEFYFNKSKTDVRSKSSLLVDIKFTLNGGQRYLPILLNESNSAGQTIYDMPNAFIPKYKDYFRTDIKVGYKLNGKKITQEWSLNIQNASNHRNVFSQVYDAVSKKIVTRYQIGLLPILQYKVLF